MALGTRPLGPHKLDELQGPCCPVALCAGTNQGAVGEDVGHKALGPAYPGGAPGPLLPCRPQRGPDQGAVCDGVGHQALVRIAWTSSRARAALSPPAKALIKRCR